MDKNKQSILKKVVGGAKKVGSAIESFTGGKELAQGAYEGVKSLATGKKYAGPSAKEIGWDAVDTGMTLGGGALIGKGLKMASKLGKAAKGAKAVSKVQKLLGTLAGNKAKSLEKVAEKTKMDKWKPNPVFYDKNDFKGQVMMTRKQAGKEMKREIATSKNNSLLEDSGYHETWENIRSLRDALETPLEKRIKEINSLKKSRKSTLPF